MQFRHPESYRILSDGRILQDPMGSGVGYVDLGRKLYRLIVRLDLLFVISGLLEQNLSTI